MKWESLTISEQKEFMDKAANLKAIGYCWNMSIEDLAKEIHADKTYK